MKIQFRTLNYQLDAVQAVVDCFQGQPKTSSNRYLRDLGIHKTPSSAQLEMDIQAAEFDPVLATEGFANAPIFSLEQVLKNIQQRQQESGLMPSEKLITDDNGKGKNLTGSPLNLDVEMETGTGKTYCYIRTIFELNKHYGWSKFIIVVPSIAIREGVHKSLSMMSDHFQQLYHQKARSFIYDSKSLHNLESFSADGGINVMIINVQAFNATGQDNRRIYEVLDEFQSRKPIDVINKNRPILILDEPQKMQADKTLQSLANFNPLFILRYSATHKRNYNLIYRLDALDAYNQKLVKKITVKGIEVQNLSGTNGYLYLENIEHSKGSPVARLELEVATKTGFKRQVRKIGNGDNLFELTKAKQYQGYVVADIRYDTLEFTNGVQIRVGEALGDVNETAIRTIQIRETIRSHLQKERQLFDRGIKVLSLFFIDEVAKYRQYDSDGNAIDGEYVKLFKEQYQAVLAEFEAENLATKHYAYWNHLQQIDLNKTHNGYFSIDKKSKRLVDPKVDKKVKEELVSNDSDAYDLILKDKERLLSFNEPTRFIFSHSALREGWDNPNVFTICTLKHSDNVISRRQEVGRGLRLAVNERGERMDASHFGENSREIHQLNNLTVITNESYTEFVKHLQGEMLEAISNRPTKADPTYFENKLITLANGEKHRLTEKEAKAAYRYLVKNDYIDDNDQITEAYHQAKQNQQLAPLPEDLQPYQEQIIRLIDAVLNPALLNGMIDNGRSKKLNPINPANLARKEFKALWQKINHKAVFEIRLDSEKLIEQSAAEIQKVSKKGLVQSLYYKLSSGNQKAEITQQDLVVRESFADYQTRREQAPISQYSQVKYDLIGEIATRTQLTRQTVGKILLKLDRSLFAQYKMNPESFIREISRLINEQAAQMIIQHLSYVPLQEGYPDNEIFVSNEVPNAAEPTARHIWEYVATDSDIEVKFAKQLEAAKEVLVYAKLPSSFKIPTPFGDYNPDWAIVFEQEAVRQIYFVAETKGSTESDQLRSSEKNKIESAQKFFEALNAELDGVKVRYDVVSGFEWLMEKALNC